jgi:eukaryotic-like serine/threonine-protein kinase
MHMLIGKRLSGRYKILDMIGGGGMANVYLARDVILERDVAVKILRLDFASEEEFIRRFKREAQSATSLAHPNIVNIYDVGEENDIYYIVMEYVDGLTLKQYIQKHQPISVEKVLDIMLQLTSAVAHAHQNHIVHRDIKPQNILIDRNGNVKITDFGIAMALSATTITQTNSVLGSVHYLSPEQARGGMATKKSDIYSLGIVMFELLTGRLPFSGESAVSIALKHLQSNIPSPRRWNKSIPQSVENIVIRATAKDPFQRYESAEEMAEDLRTALEPERLNEPKFIIPEDEEATKAIPIISSETTTPSLDETIVHHKNGEGKLGKQEKAKKKKRKKWPWFLFFFLIVLSLLGVLALTVLPDWLGPDEIEVPDLTGEEIDNAISTLISLGFEVGDTTETPSNEIEKGKVIKTAPNAGKVVKEGTVVDLFISSGKETIRLVDFTGRSYEQVETFLKSQGFRSVTKKEVHHHQPEGTIVGQTPEPNTEVVPEETDIEFTVSIGPEKIVLKDLTNYNLQNLNAYAEATGLVINIVEEKYDDEVPIGFVISQSPEPGTELDKGDEVKVVVSKGKKEIPPKQVFREITIPYDAEPLGTPQEIQIFIEDINHSMTEPYETFYITETVKKRLEFFIAPGEKAGFKVIKDRNVIMDEVIPYPEEE